MKKIAIMEKTNFSQAQIAQLQSLGDVSFYENLTEEQAHNLAPQYDIVVVNWINPAPFLLDMKPQSLVALLSTGYGWIGNLAQAQEKGVYVSNLPGYGTEAVAEHLLGLLLGVSKRIFSQLANRQDDGVQGVELTKKIVGIIGLGNIGKRFAEMVNFLGANVVTYNRTLKNTPIANDVSLEELLSISDIICITPSVNDQSRNLINNDNIALVKDHVIVIGSTWDIISETALEKLIAEKESVAAFDAAFEAGQARNPVLDRYVLEKKLFLTPHSAYNTVEAEIRQLDICISNIKAFIDGTPHNIVP